MEKIMKLAKIILLDDSDKKIYPQPSKHGEWAITGTFMFSNVDHNYWTKSEQIAFRDGWLGLETLGYSTFVQITSLSKKQKHIIIERIASIIHERFHPPSDQVAVEAATDELNDMIALCEHPIGTLLAINRELNEKDIQEKVRTVQLPTDSSLIPIWAIE